MTTIAELHAEISRAMNKGSSLDAVIPGYLRRAVLWLERNQTFPYMEQFKRFTIDVNTSSGLVYEIPDLVKKMRFFRLVYADKDEYLYLKKVDPADVLQIPDTDDYPTAYWISGNRAFYLNKRVDEDVTAEVYYEAYSDWPTSNFAVEKDVITLAEDVLLYQTAMALSAYTRNPENALMFKALRDEALTTLTGSVQEFKNEDAPAMGYS